MPRLAVYIYSLLGFAIGFGTLWDVFGWANLATLSLLLLCLVNVLINYTFPSRWSCNPVRFVWITAVIAAMVCLSALQVVWSHPDFGPPVVTNQEWIRSLALAVGLSSCLLVSDQIRKPLFFGVSLGFGCYGFGSVILSYAYGVSLLSPFDMHFGGVWGLPTNPTPPGIAIFGSIAIFLTVFGSTFQAFPLAGLCLSMSGVWAIAALDRRSTLFPVLLYLAYFTILLIKHLWRLPSAGTLNKVMRKIIPLVCLFATLTILFNTLSRTRLSLKLSRVLSEGVASVEFDRIDHYRFGYSRLFDTLLTGHNLLINLPPQTRALNPHWHSSPLDAMRIGGFLGFACILFWYLSLFFVFLSRSSTPIIRISSLGVLLIMSVEPTMYKTWYDVLVPQLVTYFLVAETATRLKPALPSEPYDMHESSV
ncbi:hypothetical protein [Synechococcus sp. NB0720_010]|uniref:hypothetical protein n=1 Tax=Synechococcus sp. NB0720_010 TaxID=2907159 RepID=UPI001FFC0BDC|nr:hypothetical protein [Synechococcus sp. NB0720_010]UPH89165.1 hypothetical protein LY254_07565 [Synechococcus sp. NB0720_010]